MSLVHRQVIFLEHRDVDEAEMVRSSLVDVALDSLHHESCQLVRIRATAWQQEIQTINRKHRTIKREIQDNKKRNTGQQKEKQRTFKRLFKHRTAKREIQKIDEEIWNLWPRNTEHKQINMK